MLANVHEGPNAKLQKQVLITENNFLFFLKNFNKFIFVSYILQSVPFTYLPGSQSVGMVATAENRMARG